MHAHRPMLGDGSFDVLSLPYHLCCRVQIRIPTGGHTPELLAQLRGSLFSATTPDRILPKPFSGKSHSNPCGTRAGGVF
ncbi:TPA: hypothetical protein ACHWC7_004298, partial [Providencia stuartii]